MYEPIRTGPVDRTGPHPMADPAGDFPHRSREEELDIQLAGHLRALLAVTQELRAVAPCADLDSAAERLADQVARLHGADVPIHAPVTAGGAGLDPSALQRRAHALAGRALVVAASRADTAAAILAAERMDAHAAATRDAQRKASGTTR